MRPFAAQKANVTERPKMISASTHPQQFTEKDKGTHESSSQRFQEGCSRLDEMRGKSTQMTKQPQLTKFVQQASKPLDSRGPKLKGDQEVNHSISSQITSSLN